MAIYECEKCETVLSPGLWACPQCGDPFDAPVPGGDELPTPDLTDAQITDDASLSEYVLPLSRPGARSQPQDSAYLYLSAPAQTPPVVAPPPPRTRSGTKRAIGVAILLIVVLGVVSFILGMKYRQSHHIVVVAFLTQHSVTYRVTGTAPIVDVIYQDGMGATQQINNTTLPWSQTYTVNSGTSLYLCAQTRGGGGHITTEIAVDGRTRKTAATEGAYTTVYVNDNLP